MTKTDDGITGHTITAVRRPTAAEYETQGWDDVWDRVDVTLARVEQETS